PAARQRSDRGAQRAEADISPLFQGCPTGVGGGRGVPLAERLAQGGLPSTVDASNGRRPETWSKRVSTPATHPPRKRQRARRALRPHGSTQELAAAAGYEGAVLVPQASGPAEQAALAGGAHTVHQQP